MTNDAIASNKIMEVADFLAATGADPDARSWGHLLVYLPKERERYEYVQDTLRRFNDGSISLNCCAKLILAGIDQALDRNKRPFAFAVRRAPDNGQNQWRLFMDEEQARTEANQLDGSYEGLYRVGDRRSARAALAPAEKAGDVPTTFYSVLNKAGVEYSAYSCGGVNLFGDKGSISKAVDAFHSHSQIDDLKTQIRHWRDECGKLHSKAATPTPPSADVVKKAYAALFEPAESDAIDNLEGALIDIKRLSDAGKPTDAVCIRTVERVQQQLIKAHEALIQSAAHGGGTKSDGGALSSLPSGKSDPVVTQDYPPSDPAQEPQAVAWVQPNYARALKRCGIVSVYATKNKREGDVPVYFTRPVSLDREALARIIDSEAKFDEIEGVKWSIADIERRNLAHQKADAILALIEGRT